MLLMLGFFVAFAVKLPAWPLHTWLPDAHTDAPTAGSVLLAGVLIKIGAYGMIRFMVPLFPDAAYDFRVWALILGVVGIIYGALLAYAQTGPEAAGRVHERQPHGLRAHRHLRLEHLGAAGRDPPARVSRPLHGRPLHPGRRPAGPHPHPRHGKMGGLWQVAPRMGGTAMFFAMASLGLPGLGNFVAEFLILVGVWQVSHWAAVLGAVGLVFATVYALWMMQRAFQGEETHGWKFTDLTKLEIGMFASMIAALVLLGFWPQPLITTARQTVAGLQRDDGAEQSGAAADRAETRRLGRRRGRRPGGRRDRRRGRRRRRRPVKAGDLLTIAPLIALTLTPVVVMLAAAFWRSHVLAFVITLAGLVTTFGLLFVSASRAGRVVTPLVTMDAYTLFFIGLLVVATAIVALLSWGYLRRLRVRPEEYYVLLLTATLGGATLVASTHFASLFLGLEILSVSLYALIVYPVYRADAVEAAVKYLVLAGATSAFLIFGMALVYAESGTMSAAGVSRLVTGLGSGDVVVIIGIVMLLVGVGFKLAVVPFHMWTPDVYQGAPAPVTAYVATVSKGAVFALLLRYLLPVSSDQGSTLFLALTAVAIASMVAGNLLALRQDNVKRILAYSSIAHLGYLLVAFLASGERAGVAAGFYLIAYFATTLAAFGVVTVLSTADRDADLMLDYRGLGARRPWLAAIFAVALFSLAGMPLTMGFIGKFVIVAAGAGSALWALVIVLVVTSTIGLYYYTRLIVAMYVRRPEELELAGAGPAARVAAAGGAAAVAVLGALSLFLLVFGVYPTPLLRLVEHAVSVLPWP